MVYSLYAPNRDISSPDELVRDLGQIPSSPVVLPVLMAQLSDDSVPLTVVVDLIKLDAGIAARILQVANSAFYGRPGRCEFIDEAVHRIGFLKTHQLVSFASASRLLMLPLTTYGMPAQELWRRSVAAAIAAEILADQCGLNAQLAYTTGLFHGVGLVAIDTWARHRDPATKVRTSGFPKEMTQQEAEAFGFDNAAVAASLLRSWRFPEPLVEAIRWQYQPASADLRNQPMACVLSVARWIRDALIAPSSAAAPLLPPHWELAAIGQSVDGVIALVAEVRKAFAEANHLLAPTELESTAG